MAVPDFQSILLPLIKLISDGEEYRFRDTIGSVSDHFELSDEDRAESIASGPLKINNRVGWATTHLSKAGLLYRPRHGVLKITDRGTALLQELLREGVDSISLKLLDRYPEHIAFRTAGKNKISPSTVDATSLRIETQTPSEAMDETYKTVRNNLADELLSQVKSCSPGFFEKLVVNVLVAMGYGGTRKDAGEVIGKSGDGGIDGTIKEDRLGLDTIYVQAKRWEKKVPVAEVRAFSGAMDAHGASKGVLIATSSFPESAYNEVSRMQKTIALVDGEQLAELMIDFNIGVTLHTSYEIKRIDSDYFEEV